MTPGRLEGKVCIVTGSSTGLGRAIALAFAREGADLVICADKSIGPPMVKQPMDATSESIQEESQPTDALIRRKYGSSRCQFVHTDVSNPDNVKQLVATAVQLGKRLDVLVNNAGVGPVPMRLHELGDDQLDPIMNVNVRGPFLCSKYAIQEFLKQDPVNGRRGRIVNIASGAALREVGFSAAYCASKAAVVSLTKTTALDYAVDGIICNAICPGFIKTSMTGFLFEDHGLEEAFQQMTPLGLSTNGPEDVAEAAVFLASDAAAWITGVALPVDGGGCIRT